MFAFDHVEASKRIEFRLCHGNVLEEMIECFLAKNQMDAVSIAKYISEVESMLFEICYDQECEYNSVIMYIADNKENSNRKFHLIT